jgi:hypothetical protein
MAQGNITPEHSFEEVNMLHSPDSTLNVMEELLWDIYDEESPPTKRPRGPGYSWNESSRVQVTEGARNVQDLDMFKKIIGTDSRLKVARSPISSHLKKVYGWRCKSKMSNKQKRISKLLPGHPCTAPGKYMYILEETIGDQTSIKAS